MLRASHRTRVASATADVATRFAAVSQDLLVLAAGVFEGVGEDGQVVPAAFPVDDRGETTDGVLTGGEIPAMAYRSRTQAWGPAPLAPKRNMLVITAKNLAAVTIDVAVNRCGMWAIRYRPDNASRAHGRDPLETGNLKVAIAEIGAGRIELAAGGYGFGAYGRGAYGRGRTFLG